MLYGMHQVHTARGNLFYINSLNKFQIKLISFRDFVNVVRKRYDISFVNFPINIAIKLCIFLLSFNVPKKKRVSFSISTRWKNSLLFYLAPFLADRSPA